MTDLVNMSAEIEILLAEHALCPFLLMGITNGKILNAKPENFEEYFKLPREAVIGRDYDVWIAGAF